MRSRPTLREGRASGWRGRIRRHGSRTCVVMRSLAGSPSDGRGPQRGSRGGDPGGWLLSQKYVSGHDIRVVVGVAWRRGLQELSWAEVGVPATDLQLRRVGVHHLAIDLLTDMPACGTGE